MADLFGVLPYLGEQLAAGFITDTGLNLSPYSRVVAYVRSSGAPSGDGLPAAISQRILPSVEAVPASAIVGGRGDVIIVLPGHTENVNAAGFWDHFPEDTMIVGLGNRRSQNGPRITFSATASQIAPANRGIRFRNLQFRCTANVVAGISPTAPEVSIEKCYFLTNTSTAQAVAMISVTSGNADKFVVDGCEFSGPTANPTTGADILLNAAGALDTRIVNNLFQHGAVTTTGFISIAAAATGIYISGNEMHNSTASSTACIAVADVASDGFVTRNLMACTSGGTSAAEGILVTGTTSTIRFAANFNTSDARASGILAPAVAT